jgi:uncharacterized protein (DUF488 family)
MILTIGHSNRPLDEFIRILKFHNIDKIADVRTIPRSRYNPQFNKDTLPAKLKSVNIGYVHMPGLGGLRHAQKDSLNTAWQNASFRGFADYMQTKEFATSLEKLIVLGSSKRIALMCAESLPWRCHRSLIADALLVRGIKVEHIFSLTNSKEHVLTAWAKVKGRRIVYAAPSKHN